jgi:hypothetical protein
MRVTMEMLRNELKYLNEITKDDKYPYQFYIAYGSYGLDKVVNDGGGCKTIIGLTTKKELYNQMETLIKGIQIGKEG